jgi:hypothetical protein
MKVAIVLHTDRHSDPSVFVFTDPDKAIQFAQDRCKEFDRFGDAKEGLTESMAKAGWLYYASMEDVGYIRVTLADLQE